MTQVVTDLKAVLFSPMNDAIMKSRDGEFEIRFVSTQRVHQTLHNPRRRGGFIGEIIHRRGISVFYWPLCSGALKTYQWPVWWLDVRIPDLSEEE
uniref:DUF4283 domain-containing protein n=1 Tax=Rodentolepis nana TaxID=102285 RepID=A0A158QH75_RODNA